MANQGELLPNHPVHADVQPQAGHRDHQQNHLLDAARALMLLGAAAAVSTVGNHDADAARVFLAFATCWLLGVCLLSLVPVAGRFLQADRLAGAAIASAGAVLRRFFIQWNKLAPVSAILRTWAVSSWWWYVLVCFIMLVNKDLRYIRQSYIYSLSLFPIVPCLSQITLFRSMYYYTRRVM
jgi:hypothetical protein